MLKVVVTGPVKHYSAESWPKTPFNRVNVGCPRPSIALVQNHGLKHHSFIHVKFYSVQATTRHFAVILDNFRIPLQLLSPAQYSLA